MTGSPEPLSRKQNLCAWTSRSDIMGLEAVTVDTIAIPPPAQPGPAWEIARLFPDQGQWGVGDYLELNRQTNRLVEFDDGRIEVLDMPTRTHQRIVLYLYKALMLFVEPRQLGEALVAPYPVRLWEGKFREPDIVFMLAAHRARLRDDYAEGADLVVEVLSEARRRDLDTKRVEYARAGIPEYWIVDPQKRCISVLLLQDGVYRPHADSQASDVVRSLLLEGLTIDSAAMFTAIEAE